MLQRRKEWEIREWYLEGHDRSLLQTIRLSRQQFEETEKKNTTNMS